MPVARTTPVIVMVTVADALACSLVVQASAATAAVDYASRKIPVLAGDFLRRDVVFYPISRQLDQTSRHA
jgi:hypothetical protein